MLQCKDCSSKQAEGKFCGSCGGQLVQMSEKESSEVEQPEQAAAQPVQAEEEVSASEVTTEASTSPSSNEIVEQAVGVSKEFSSYFKEYIKEPSLIFPKKENEFKNGLISTALVALLIALTVSGLYRNIAYNEMYYSFVDMPSPISMFGSILLFMVIAIIVTLALLFIINKFFGTESSFKEITSIFGVHMLPVNILALLSFILVLIKSNTTGWILLFIAFGLVISMIPIYLINSLLTQSSKGVDPFYGYLLYLIAVGITYTVLFAIFVDSAIGNFLNSIPYW